MATPVTAPSILTPLVNTIKNEINWLLSYLETMLSVRLRQHYIIFNAIDDISSILYYTGEERHAKWYPLC